MVGSHPLHVPLYLIPTLLSAAECSMFVCLCECQNVCLNAVLLSVSLSVCLPGCLSLSGCATCFHAMVHVGVCCRALCVLQCIGFRV